MHAWCKKLKGICFDEEPQLPKKERGDDIIMRISAQFSSKSLNGCVWILGTLPKSIHFPCWIILGYRMLRHTQIYTPYWYVIIIYIYLYIIYTHTHPILSPSYPQCGWYISPSLDAAKACRIAEPKLLKSIGRPRWTRLGSRPDLGLSKHEGLMPTWRFPQMQVLRNHPLN